MAIAKRCKFCGKKLDSKGYCQNDKCPDYERTKLANPAYSLVDKLISGSIEFSSVPADLAEAVKAELKGRVTEEEYDRIVGWN